MSREREALLRDTIKIYPVSCHFFFGFLGLFGFLGFFLYHIVHVPRTPSETSSYFRGSGAEYPHIGGDSATTRIPEDQAGTIGRFGHILFGKHPVRLLAYNLFRGLGGGQFESHPGLKAF